MEMTRATTSGGFTLIELLTVMAVMIIVTSITVSSGFGISRSAKYDSAVQLPVNALEYAHQRACMDGRETAVVFAKDDNDQYYATIFQAIGKVSNKATGKSIEDRFSDMRASGVNGTFLTAFSFNTGGRFYVSDVQVGENSVKFSGGGKAADDLDYAADSGKNTYWYDKVTLVASDTISGFNTGDTYGFEIADRIIMPANFTYSCSGGHTKGDSFWVVFSSNGAGDTATITVGEAVGKSKFKAEIKVSAGNVSVRK